MNASRDRDLTDSGVAGVGADHDLWVFGYGSLMWRPGFNAVERQPAVLTGLNRSFCVYSYHHRGTPGRPGLVLGLDRGGVCHGVAFRVGAADVSVVKAYLRAREQVTGVYNEIMHMVELADGSRRHVLALCYVVERAHPQYSGILPLSVQARIIKGAAGISGVNLDYLISTLQHLRAENIKERALERLMALVGPHVSSGGRVQTLARSRAMTCSYMRQPHPCRAFDRAVVARFGHRRAVKQ